MRILIDECVDWRLLRDLPNHDVKTVRQMGWSETVNGALLTLAEQSFDVLVTTDKNLSFQQNVGRFKIGVVVLRARSARLRHLRELVPALV
jgi:predicted nuclease of predicted toxin-antitoxin system